MKNPRTIARIVGTLMLAAFLLYGVGSSLATSAAPGSVAMTVGLAMMLLNTAAVVAIGALVFPILRPHAAPVAIGYAATRLFEGTLLAVGAVALVAGAVAVNFLAYHVAMAGLGIGSLFFCLVLYRARLVPRVLAGAGFLGYAAFATGSLLELFGVAGASLWGAMPGGLFEVAFASWLLVRGFRAPSAVAVRARPTHGERAHAHADRAGTHPA